jgi:hypothetical protein
MRIASRLVAFGASASATSVPATRAATPVQSEAVNGGARCGYPFERKRAVRSTSLLAIVSPVRVGASAGGATKPIIGTAAMVAAIDRTKTHHEKAYDRLPVEDRLTTRVRLTLKDGSSRDKVVAHPRGTGDRLLTNADIVAKYRSLTGSVTSTDRQAAIEKAVLNLDALEDISELTVLLTPTVRSALD